MPQTYTRTLLLGFALSLIQAFAFGQAPDWKFQNPLPTGNTLRDVQFLDAQNGWVIGAFGIILRTTNGGSSWQSQSSGTTNNLNSVHFTDTQNGWAVGQSGTILKTSNGGRSWQSQSSGTSDWLYSIHFTDAQRGWAVGSNGTIIKTSNGGSSWQSQNNGGTTRILYCVFFADAQNGWAVGENGTMLNTSNGGSSWQNQSSSTANNLSSVHFTNAQNGWAVGSSGTILKTSNGGSSWQSQSLNTTSTFLSVHFNDPQNGCIVGINAIQKTSNGGISWQFYGGVTISPLNSVHFINAQTGWAVGQSGIISKTSNGGNSWQNQGNRMGGPLFSVHFKDYQNGWAVGALGTILKTSNRGSSWQNQISGTLNSLNSIHFTDVQNGWAVGDGGTILKTTNGGNSWSSQSSGTTYTLKAVHFTDTQNGWAVSDIGIILKTSNGGSSWIGQSSGTTRDLFSVYFTDAQNGWVVGDNGTILRTTNGGNSWLSHNSGTTNHLYSVHFIDAQNGWAVGIGGKILKTSDGGSSWMSQSSGTTNNLLSVQFIDPQNGCSVGNGGKIIKTSNGGNSWFSQSSGTTSTIFSVYFTDPLHGWAVGGFGTILTTKTNNYISPETPSTLILGNLFAKTAANCNPSPIPVSNRLVKALPGPYYGISESQGQYNLRLPLADTSSSFTLQALENQSQAFNEEVICPPDNLYNITVDTIPDTLSGNNFGFEITPCHHLDVQLSSNRRRRCFTNSTAISYFNQGAIAATNAYVLVEFPKWVRPLSASRNYVALNDSVWRFDLGDVQPGTGGNFTISDTVLCGNLAILGLSQCTKATAFPAPNCPPSSNWSGAEVSISGRCQSGGFAELGIYNRTSINMPDSVDYFMYLDSIEVKTGKVKLAAGDSLKFQVETTGYDVHLTAMQVRNHPTEAYVSLSLEGCMLTTGQPRGIATHFPIQQQPNSKTQCMPIIGAYDPNVKQVFPLGFTANRVVAPNTELEYLVRFQNTGNDTAFTVYIIDTLHTNLNVESFEMGAASHPYQLSMQTTKGGKTWLRWQFNNILLPDSNVNEPKSHGFVQFRISPKANLPLGTQVFNEADIYFDFNPPILTNQTLTTFDIIRFTDTTLNRNVRIILPTSIPSALRNAMKLYPNPVTNNQLNINFAEAGSLTLYDARGQVVFAKDNLMGDQVLPVQLKQGMYVARINSKSGSWSEKVVVE